MLAHAYNSSTLEGKAGRNCCKFEARIDYTVSSK